ncbi:hypothetical protein [Anaerosporobacter faecicola]|uniref:hypothetical protein n=1 Tax=Anaerosporobacter faecicola TaxID=2718714 RepID=UPI001438D5BD|nr:hypothetical protein [Anaerosporobacter faecicola]
MVEFLFDAIAQYLFQAMFYVSLYSFLMQADTRPIAGILFLLPFSFLLTLLRRYSKKFWVFLMGLVVYGTILATFISMVGKNAILMSAVILFCIMAFIIRIVPSAKVFEQPNNIPLGTMGIIYIILEFIQYEQAGTLAFWIVFLYILVYLLNRNYQNMMNYIVSRRRTTIMAEGKIKHAFHTHITLYIGGLALIMLLFATISFDHMYQSMVTSFTEITNRKEANPVEFGAEKPSFDNVFQEEKEIKEPSPLFLLIEKVIRVLMSLVTVAIMLVMFGFLLRGIYLGFYNRKRGKKEEQLFASVEMRERIEKKKRNPPTEPEEKDLRMRLRKIYRKKMFGFWKNTNKNPANTTPNEQMLLKRAKGSHMQQEAIQLYEKARYSKQDITEEDIRHIKDSFREKQRKNE